MGEIVELKPEKAMALVTPMQMLASALERNMSVEVLEKLLTLQERWEANQGKRAFDEAISAANASIPPIVKNKQGHNGKYATFAAIDVVVRPILAKHGLSYRFRTQESDKINVTCILSHRDGHSEENTLSGAPDKTGSKNDIQAKGSLLTYLQRYLLVQALGLAAADDDDAKATSSVEKIDDAQIEELVTLSDDVGADKIKFCKYFKIASLADLPKSRFNDAVNALKSKKNAGAA